MEIGSEFHLPIPAAHTVLVYVFEGQATFGEQALDAVKMGVLDKGDQIEI
jgi:redox-sensitive bicupin YhaK (pirin superfamily)